MPEPDDDASVPAEESGFEPGPAAAEAPAVPRSAGRFVAEACEPPASATRSPSPARASSACSMRSATWGSASWRPGTRAAAAFMAEAYGQLTGRPAACLGTRAVGAANLAIGIHTASQDSTPMFAIVGQVARNFRGREAFQEVDQIESSGGSPNGAPSLDPSTSSQPRSRKPSGRPLAAGPARSCCRSPRTCSMRRSR